MSQKMRTGEDKHRTTLKADRLIWDGFDAMCTRHGFVRERVVEALLAYASTLEPSAISDIVARAGDVIGGQAPKTVFGREFQARMRRAWNEEQQEDH